MNKKIEELFDLMPADIDQEMDILEDEESMSQDSMPVTETISSTEKIDMALQAVTDLNKHDAEMDDIAAKALKTYNDLISLGLSVTENNAGEIFGVAAQMLKTALEARDSKVNRKLKMVDLMIKQRKLDQDVVKGKAASAQLDSEEAIVGAPMDRNEIIKLLKERSVEPELAVEESEKTSEN